MPEITPIPNMVDIASVRTDSNKYLYLPATSSIYGKTITVKDITGGASNHPITLYTQGPDTFEDGTSSNIIDISFGYTSFFAKSNIWYLINNKANTGEADANYGTVTRDIGVQSVSSIISYGLSSIYAPFDNIPLSSIFSYGLSTIYSPYGLSSLSSITSYSISSFSSIIGLSFITNSTFTTYISSPFAEFSSISTQTLIIGNLEYPLNIDIGLNTPSIRIDEIEADISYIKSNVGIGREATDEYILDITPDNYARFKSIEVESIRADRLIGNASLITNVSKQDGGLSSLSSIISYGLSSIITPKLTDSIKSLSTIVSYGLSTVALNLQLDSNITSFHASNIGGTGILGTNIQSDNDTYTSAIGKIDSWLYNNIVGNPPVPTIYERIVMGNVNEGLTFIAWNAPFQTKIGFGNDSKYIPYISSLTIELSNIYVGTFCNITLGSNYIPLIGSNIEGLVFKLYTTRDLPEFSISNLGGKNILNIPVLLTPRDGGGLTPKTYITPLNINSETTPSGTTPSDFIKDGDILNEDGDIINEEGTNITPTQNNTAPRGLINEVWLEQPEYIFSAHIWYANYSLDPYNILEFSNLTFCNGNIPRQGPDPPQAINICNISDDSITINIISPTYSVKGTEISPSYISFSNYYIDINRSVSSRRYSDTSVFLYRKYDPLPVKSNYQSNISDLYNFNDLIPDTTYSINIGIDNSFYTYKNDEQYITPNSSNLGLCNISITTLLPSAPPSITDIIVESNIGKYQYSGEAIYDNNNIRYDSIYNTNTMNLQFTTNPLGIHTISNPGIVTDDIISTFAINISNIRLINKNYVYDILSYFSYDIIYTPEQIYNNSIKISGIVRDYYSNDNIRSNFYQVFTPIITISNLTPNKNPYIFTLYHENIILSSNITILEPYSNYYIDDINDIPSLTGWTIEEQNTIYISGVKVTGYSNTLLNNIDIQNLGRYFYRYNQNLLVATYCNYNINISSNNIYNQRTALYTTDNSYQTLPLQNPVRIKSIISINCNILYTPASNSNGGFTIYTQLCNLVGQSYPSLNSFIYFDAQSESIVRTVINSPNSIGGLRLESQMSGVLIMPSSNLINNLPYSNTSNIYTNYNNKTDYRYELPLVNGYFRTAANLSNLYDYIHLYYNTSLTGYSNIKNETTKIRYATFKYSFINSSEMIVSQLKLEINNSVGFNSNPDGTYNSSVAYLYYYVETPGIYNSNWINANKIRNSSFPFNSNDRTGLRKDSITSNSRYLFLIPIQPDVPYNVYVRIGLQMNCNINFNYITISPGFNTNPGPSNPTITSFISQDYSLKLNWINTDFDYGGIINITPNTLFSEDPILRRYIPSGVDGIIQESHFKDVIYDDIRGLTTFSNTYSNYDTPYNAILSFTNENGQTSTEQYPLNNRQLFNVGSNYLLYGVVFNKVYSASSNSYSNYIQLRSLQNIAANIRLYNEKDTYEILKTINTHSGLVNLRVLAGIDTPDGDKINYMLNLTRRFTTSNLAGIVIGNNVFSNLNSTYNSNRAAYVNAGCNAEFLDQFDGSYIINTNNTLFSINGYINQLRNGIIADGNWMPPIGFAESPEFFNYYSILNRTNNNKTLERFLSNIDFFGLNAKDDIQTNIQDMTNRFISNYNNIRFSLDNLNISNTNIWITEVGYSNIFPEQFLNSIINWYNDSLYRDKKIPFYWYSLIDTEYDNWGLFSKSLNPKWDLLSDNIDIGDVNYIPLSIIFDPSNDLYYSSTGTYANWISNYIPPSATSLPPYNAPYFYEVQSYLNISNIGVRSHIHSNIYSIITRKIEPFFLYEYLQNQFVQFDYGDGFSGYGINDLPGKDLSNWSFIASWLNVKPPTNNIFTFSNDLYVYSNSTYSITQESNITLNITNISDQYSSGQATGFYMKAYANIIVTYDIYNNDNIDYTKPNIFSISLNNPDLFHVINSSNYYIDNFRNSIPNVVSIDVDSNEIILLPGIYSNYICGVLCFSGLNSNTFYVGISNIGSYAYVSDLFSGEIYGSNLRFNNKLPFYYDQGLQIINNSFSNITYIPVRHSFGRSLYSASNNFVFSNIIVKNVYNSNNSSNIIYYGFQNKNLLFDDPSIKIVNREKLTYEYDFAPGFQRNFGQRVESGTTLYPDIGQFGSNFNNTFNILQGQYFNEIQLANGYYRTYYNATLNGASNGYLQYKNFYDPYSRHINYAIIPSEYQYVTYSWHISPTDMNFSNVRLFYTFGGDTIYNGTTFNGIQILFKIVASNETTSLPNNKTTGWLNANALTDDLNSNNKSSDGVACSFNITNENISILFPEPYEQYCNVDFKIYIKFGLPSSSNISLEVGNLNINNTLKPFSNDSLTLTLSNNNSLYLGIGASIVPTLGTTYIQFKASNIYGNVIIQPSNYTNLSEIITNVTYNYYINYADCAYNSNTASNNVSLWIYASNTYNNKYYAFESSLDGSTGQQCNFSPPTINNYSNVMNIDGSVTTRFAVDNSINGNRGDIVWNLSYYNASNNIRCNSRSFSNVQPYYYSNSDMIVDSNFYQYYSNTVTLTVTIQSNCWLPESNTSSNLTSNYIPISGEYIGLQIQSNSTRDVGLKVTRSNGIDGRPIRIYFRASNIYTNKEGTIIQPTNYNFIYSGLINVGSPQYCNILNTDCSYNCNTTLCNVGLWILASNTIRPFESYYASLEGSTGNQCNFSAPTISNYSNVMNIDGSVTTTFAVDNNVNLNRGTVVWSLEYYNASNNITCNAGPFSNREFYYSNSDMIVESNFYQYYSNIVTLSVSVQSNCWSNSPLSNTSELTSNYIPISEKYIRLELQSNSTRDVGLKVTRSNGIDGRPIKIYFRASNIYTNKEGTILQPSTYDYTLNNFINVGTLLSYNIVNTDCSYNCNAGSNNVALWILASNTIRPFENYYASLEGSTGNQCNFFTPTISNYSNVMNVDGSVTTTFALDNNVNLGKGTVVWRLEYYNASNNITCNAGPFSNREFYYSNSDMIVDSNFYQYYSNIVTLSVSVQSNCWSNSPLSNTSNLTSNYIPISGEYIGLELQNNNTRDVGLKVTRSNGIDGRQIKIYFWASNNYTNKEGTIIQPTYDYALNNFINLNTPQFYNIVNTDCSYNCNTALCNVRLWILASNANRPNETYSNFVNGSTGPQCNLPVPTISNYSNVMNIDGSVTTYATIHNYTPGTISWSIKYSNIDNGTVCNITPTINNTCNISFCNYPTMKNNTNFYQYYNNNVTLNVDLSNYCWTSNSNSASNLTSNYIKIDNNSINVSILNSNSLYLGARVTLTKSITGNAAIFFKASNMYGTTITPSNYNYISYNTYNRENEGSDYFIDYSDCFYNDNTSGSNVTLWILASNTREPFDDKYDVPLLASTGGQCNFSNPIITNHSNSMTNRGFVKTSFTVDNSINNNRGVINWFITYSNAATGSNFITSNFSCNNYTSPFTFTYDNSNNSIRRPDFFSYYSNIVTLNLTVDSNCWISGFSNIASNTDIYRLMTSNSFRTTVTNSNSLSLGITVEQIEQVAAIPAIYFKASNIYSNIDGTIITPSEYIYLGNFINLNDSLSCNIEFNHCYYNCNTASNNVALWILASNTIDPFETYYASLSGSTGEQCNFQAPTIIDYSNTMDPRGYVITYFTVDNSINNNRGVIKWFITYSNAATGSNFIASNFSCNNYTSPFTFTYNNSNNSISRPNFSSYYSNIVTLNMTVDSNCWRSGFSNIATNTIPYVPIDSRSLRIDIINNNTRDLGAVLTLTNTLTGNPDIITFFWASNRYFNSEGTYITPSNYDSALTSNLSNTIGASNRFTIVNTECSYNSNIARCNVALWIFASNTNYPNETFSNYVDGSTGPQCNLPVPTISNYSNVMNIDGSVTTYATIHNYMPGTISWSIKYSNIDNGTICNISPANNNTNTISFCNYPTMKNNANFYQYYNNIVTLNVDLSNYCWTSNSNSASNLTSNYIRIDNNSINVSILNSNSLYLGARVRLTKSITGNAAIFFKASNMYGTTITPSNYNYISYNTYNRENEGSDYFINYCDCFFNGTLSTSNVTLWILASNTREPSDDKYDVPLLASTGGQCNFSNPIITNYSNTMTNRGFVETSFTVDNSINNYRGVINWFITYSNAATGCNFIASNFRCNNYTSPFTFTYNNSNNNVQRPNFSSYYSNIVTLNMTVDSNCWRSGFSNIATNTIPYVPIDSRSLRIDIINNNTRDLGAVLTLTRTLTGNPNIRTYFRASNIYSNFEGTIIQPSIYNFVTPSNLPNNINASNRFTIVNTECSYNCNTRLSNVALWIFASNTNYPNETFSNYVDGSTGPQCNFNEGTSISVTNNLVGTFTNFGVFFLTARVNNSYCNYQGATTRWRVNLSNKYNNTQYNSVWFSNYFDGCNFTTLRYSNVPPENESLRYFDNSVTIEVEMSSNCWDTLSVTQTFFTQSLLLVVQPILRINPFNYIFTSNYTTLINFSNYVTISNTINRSLIINTRWTTLADAFSSNNSNYLASNIIPDSNYNISAYYEVRDSDTTNIFRSPVSDEYPFTKYVYTRLQGNIISNSFIFTSNSDRFITLIKADIYDDIGNNCNNFFNTATGDSTKNIYLEYRVRSNNPTSERKYEIGGQDRYVKFGSDLTFTNTRFNVVTMSLGNRLSSSAYNKYYIQSYIYYNICNIVSPGQAIIRSFRLNYSNDPTAAYNNTQLELNSEFLVIQLSNTGGTACNYRITFQPIQNNIYPRRWVPSVDSNPVFQEAHLSNIIIRANPGITTYSNTFSNYDTQYRVTVRTDNEFMIGSNSSNILDTSVMFPYNSNYLMAGGYTFDLLTTRNQYIQAYYYYLNRLQRIMPSARMLGSTDGTPFQGYEFALSLLTRYSSALGNFKLILDCGYQVNTNGFIDNNALTDNIDYLTSIVEMYGTQNIGGIEFGNNIYGKVIKSKPEGDNDINWINLITSNYTILSNQLIYLRNNLSTYGHPPPIIYADYNISNIRTFIGSLDHFNARTTFSNFINMVDTFGMQQYGEPSLTTTSNINVYCNAVNTLYNNYRGMLRGNIRIILNEFGDGPIQINKRNGYEDITDTGALLARYTVYTAIQEWANSVSPQNKPILQFNYRINCNVYSRYYGTNMFIREQNITGLVLRLNPNVGQYIYNNNVPKRYTYENSNFILYSSSNETYPARIGDPGGFTPTLPTFCNPRRTPLPEYNRPSFEDVNKFKANGDSIDIMEPPSLTSDTTGYSVFNSNINNIILTENSNNLFYIDYSTPVQSGYFMGSAPGARTSYILNTLPGSNLENVRFSASLIKLKDPADSRDKDVMGDSNEYTCSNQLYRYSNTSINISKGILTLDNVRDMYTSGGRTGFHMIANPWIRISQEKADELFSIYGSNTKYIAILRAYQKTTHMNLNSKCSFMIDNPPYRAPSIHRITTSNVADRYLICGVLCYSGTDLNRITITASDIGVFSYPLNPVSAIIRSDHTSNTMNYNFSHDTVSFRTPIGAAGNPILGSNTQRKFFTNSNRVIINTIDYSNAYGALNVSSICLRNIHDLSSANCNIEYGYGGKNFFFDTPSITVLNNTLNSNYIPSNDFNYGRRVRNPSDYPDRFEDYNHNINLTNGQFDTELQLANGAYRTYCNARFNGASNGYLNYSPYYDDGINNINVSYTLLSNQPKKYITLLWHFDVFAIPWYAATFKFSFIQAPTYNTRNMNFPGLDINYRIIGPADNNSTNWLNANSNSTRIPTTTDSDGTVGGIRGGSNYLTVYFPRVTNNYCNVEFNLYLRIGIPNNSNVAFNYVNLYAFESESLKISLL